MTGRDLHPTVPVNGRIASDPPEQSWRVFILSKKSDPEGILGPVGRERIAMMFKNYGAPHWGARVNVVKFQSRATPEDRLEELEASLFGWRIKDRAKALIEIERADGLIEIVRV